MGCGASTTQAAAAPEQLLTPVTPTPAVTANKATLPLDAANGGRVAAAAAPTVCKSDDESAGTSDAGATPAAETRRARVRGRRAASADWGLRTSARLSGTTDLERKWKQREQMTHREGYLSLMTAAGSAPQWLRRWFVLDYGVLSVYQDYKQRRSVQEQGHRDGNQSIELQESSSARWRLLGACNCINTPGNSLCSLSVT
eukprot:COSAG01_NODE_4418_length_5045_cov_1.022038_5_plen_200_part_00